MGKKLSEMSLEELWQLFPVFLTEHQDFWHDWYAEEEVPKECNLLNIKDLLTDNGYICMCQSKDRISFNKGYTEYGFANRVFHLHLRYAGDNDELYFRDYLIEHADVAVQYEKMKLKLWKEYEHDRNAYTDAKTEFVRKWTSEGRKIYYGRY